MNRIEINQAVARNLGLIKGVVCRTLKKYGAHLCDSDIDDIASNTALCLLDGRLDKYNHTTEKKLQQWIGYISMQRCIDSLRAIKKNIQLDQDGDNDSPSKHMQDVKSLAHEDPTPEAAYLEAEHRLERRARLRAAVASLSQDEQDTYAAMASENYTTRAYALTAGIKESSVYTRRHRLIKNLRKAV